jgi:L-seryl-tRNA(Ser) seleniumtransferase
MRIDKMTLAAMEATLRLYLDPDKARERVPTLAMITMPQEELKGRAERLQDVLASELGGLAKLSVVPGISRVGGGSFPEMDLPTHLVALTATGDISPDELKKRLLATDPPLIGRIEDDVFCLDPRTLRGDSYLTVASSLKQALTN